jgi:hypothetical protein
MTFGSNFRTTAGVLASIGYVLLVIGEAHRRLGKGRGISAAAHVGENIVGEESAASRDY